MTIEKTIALTMCTFVGKVMPLLVNMLFKFVIAFLPRSKHLLISWLQSPFTVILEPKGKKRDALYIMLLLLLSCFSRARLCEDWNAKVGS